MRSESELTKEIELVEKQIEKLKQKFYHLIRLKGDATSRRLGMRMEKPSVYRHELSAKDTDADKIVIPPKPKTHEENLAVLAKLVTKGR